jgi:hypothetical protein
VTATDDNVIFRDESGNATGAQLWPSKTDRDE